MTSGSRPQSVSFSRTSSEYAFWVEMADSTPRVSERLFPGMVSASWRGTSWFPWKMPKINSRKQQAAVSPALNSTSNS